MVRWSRILLPMQQMQGSGMTGQLSIHAGPSKTEGEHIWVVFKSSSLWSLRKQPRKRRLCSGKPAVGAPGEGGGEAQAILSDTDRALLTRARPFHPFSCSSTSTAAVLTLACVFLPSPRLSGRPLPSLATGIFSDCRACGFSAHTGRGLCPALDL